MIMTNKKKNEEIDKQVALMASVLKDIYANRSSDEYKIAGEITKASDYKSIEKMIAELSILKNFPPSEARDIGNLFSTLHKPIFKKHVTEYISEPNDTNVIFTSIFTVGYRVLIGELSRIYASTEATDKGIVYKPDKVSKKAGLSDFIKIFNSNIDEKINRYIIEANKNADVVVEFFIDASLDVIKKVFIGFCRGVKAVGTLNPIGVFNTILMSSYHTKVEAYNKAVAMYNATKEAYEEYLRIPAAQRKQKIESKYQKQLDRYNIRMNNLKATLDHYDSRALAEAREKEASQVVDNNTDKTTTTTTSSSTDNSSSSDDDYSF